MSSWNFRLIEKDGYLYIHEAYYDKKGDKKPYNITKNSINVAGKDKEEIKWVLEKMKLALDKDILKYEDFEK